VNLEKLNKISPSDAKERVTKKRGIYFWYDKSDDSLVYIGIAVGSGGLKVRICSQHLNPKYLEFRSTKHTAKDSFQLNCAIEKISKKTGVLQKGIDKSAFRKSIGRKLALKPGEGTVSYIMDNLYFKVFESEDIEAIRLLEKELIILHQPKFNTAYKSASA